MDLSGITKLEDAAAQGSARQTAARNDVDPDAARAFSDSMATDNPRNEADDMPTAGTSQDDPLLALMENWSGISSTLNTSNDAENTDLEAPGTVVDAISGGTVSHAIVRPEAETDEVQVDGDSIAAPRMGEPTSDATSMDGVDSEMPQTPGMKEQLASTTAQTESSAMPRITNEPGTVIAQLAEGVLIQREGRVELVASAPSSARVILQDPAAVVRQITDALVIQREGQIEVALSPEELGRVRLLMSGRENGLHVIIMAERPEVLDMLRRNTPALLEQFADVGIGDTSLEFRQDDSDTAEGREPSGQNHGPTDLVAIASLTTQTDSIWATAPGRLDLRF